MATFTPKIENCIVHNGTGIAIQIINTSGDTINGTIKNNVVESFNGIACKVSGATVNVRNNSFVNNGNGLNDDGGVGDVTANDHNNVNGNSPNYAIASAIGANSISVSSGFVNPGANDYHLLISSALIDAGDPADSFVNETDHPVGFIDIGAYGNTNENTEPPITDIHVWSGGSTGNGTDWATAFTTIQDAIDAPEFAQDFTTLHIAGESFDLTTTKITCKALKQIWIGGYDTVDIAGDPNQTFSTTDFNGHTLIFGDIISDGLITIGTVTRAAGSEKILDLKRLDLKNTNVAGDVNTCCVRAEGAYSGFSDNIIVGENLIVHDSKTGFVASENTVVARIHLDNVTNFDLDQLFLKTPSLGFGQAVIRNYENSIHADITQLTEDGDVGIDIIGWVLFDNSSISSSFTPSITNKGGNIDGDPLFVNPGAGDFTIQSEGPGINKGDPGKDSSLEPVQPVSGQPGNGRINIGGHGAIETAAIDTTPPANVIGATLLEVVNSVQLDWTNPAGDFDGVRIMRKLTGFPVDENDGDQVFEATGDPITFTDTDILLSTDDVFYLIISFDEVPNFASGIGQSLVTFAIRAATPETSLHYRNKMGALGEVGA